MHESWCASKISTVLEVQVLNCTAHVIGVVDLPDTGAEALGVHNRDLKSLRVSRIDMYMQYVVDVV